MLAAISDDIFSFLRQKREGGDFSHCVGRGTRDFILLPSLQFDAVWYLWMKTRAEDSGQNCANSEKTRDGDNAAQARR